jgi:hypothetical protein
MAAHHPIAVFRVAESFDVAGRGVVVATDDDLSMLTPGTRYEVRVLSRVHGTLVRDATSEFLLRSQRVPRESLVLVVRHVSAEDFAPGTAVTVSKKL